MNIETILYIIVPAIIVSLMIFSLIQLRSYSRNQKFMKESYKAKEENLMSIIELYHYGVSEMSKKGLFPGCSCSKDDVEAGWCMNCCFIDAESRVIKDSVEIVSKNVQ